MTSAKAVGVAKPPPYRFHYTRCFQIVICKWSYRKYYNIIGKCVNPDIVSVFDVITVGLEAITIHIKSILFT